jgi:hypothetical protein
MVNGGKPVRIFFGFLNKTGKKYWELVKQGISDWFYQFEYFCSVHTNETSQYFDEVEQHFFSYLYEILSLC